MTTHHMSLTQDAVSPSFCYLLRHCDTLQMCQGMGIFIFFKESLIFPES